MDGVIEADNRQEDAHSVALEHGWAWFRYHADQRLSFFRFYLIAVGVVFTAYFTSLDNQRGLTIAVSVALVAGFLSFCFYMLDCRTKKLTKIGESLLAKEEERLANTLGYSEVELIRQSNASNGGRFGSHSKILKHIYTVICILFFIAAAYPLVLHLADNYDIVRVQK